MIIILLVCLVLTSCLNDHGFDELSVEDESINQELDKNPFEEAKSETEILGRLSHGLKTKLKEDEYIEYNGEEVEIPYHIELEGKARNVGFLIYLSGEPQPYKLKEESDYKYMHSINMPDNNKDITIQFEPITGKVGEVLELRIVSIYNPDFMPDMINTSGFGFYHNLLSNLSDKFKINVDTTLKSADLSPYSDEVMIGIEERTESMPSDFEETIQQDNPGFKLEDLNERVYSHIRYNGEKVYSNLNIEDDEEVDISYSIYGVPEAEYITTFYLNHKPISSTEYKLEKGRIKTIDLQLDVEEMDALSTFYVISVPKHERKYDTELVLLDNTPSILFYKGIDETPMNATSEAVDNSTGYWLPQEGNVKNVFIGQEGDLLLQSDNDTLILVDSDSKERIIEVAIEGTQGRETYRALKDGYVRHIFFNGEEGLEYNCEFYNSELELENQLSISALVEGERILGLDKVGVSSDGKYVAIASEKGVYIHNVIENKSDMILDLSKKNLEKNLGITSISSLAFVDDDNKIAFTANSYNLPVEEGKNAYSTYGLMDREGHLHDNRVMDASSDYNIDMYPYGDKVLYTQEGEPRDVWLLDTTNDKIEDYSDNLVGNGDSFFVSDQGGYYITTQNVDNVQSIRIYETASGQLIKEETLELDEMLKYKVLLSDTTKQGFLVVRDSNSRVMVKEFDLN